jgi:hypothetical protein
MKRAVLKKTARIAFEIMVCRGRTGKEMQQMGSLCAKPGNENECDREREV